MTTLTPKAPSLRAVLLCTVLSLLCLLFLAALGPGPAMAQTAQSRAALYQNTTPSPGVIANVIASSANLTDANTITGAARFTTSLIMNPGSTLFMEGSFNITTNLPVLSTCGTTPAVTAHSSGNAGEITLGTGSPTACTLTWNVNNAYTNDTFCVFGAGSSATAAISGGWYVSAHSATAVTLTLGTGTSSAVFEYTCFGN